MNNSTRVPVFQQVCYVLNTLGLYFLTAWLRRVVASRVTLHYFPYTHDSITRYYRGYFIHPRFGVIAFVRNDGTEQFRW